jgi:hypothetical protein
LGLKRETGIGIGTFEFEGTGGKGLDEVRGGKGCAMAGHAHTSGPRTSDPLSSNGINLDDGVLCSKNSSRRKTTGVEGSSVERGT